MRMGRRMGSAEDLTSEHSSRDGREHADSNLTESCFLLRFRWTASIVISIGRFSVNEQIGDLAHGTFSITGSLWSLPMTKCVAGTSPASSRLGARGVEMLRSGEVVNVPGRVVSESAEPGEATGTTDMLLLLSSRRCGTIMEGFNVGTSILGGKGAVVPIPTDCAFDMTVRDPHDARKTVLSHVASTSA